MLMYTSGTTGTPKGALLSHGNLVHAGRSVGAAHELTPADRVLSSLPLYHVNGQCIATISPLVSGGSIVMPHRFSVSQWWSLVERYRPTWLNVVPTIIAYLLNGPDLDARAGRGVPRHPLRPLGVRAAAAGAPSRVRGAIRDLGAGGDGAHRVRVGRVRQPARSRRAQDRLAGPSRWGWRRASSRPTARCCGVGERGEIELRGDNVMLGYHKDPEATARTLRPGGWLATGDLGYRDADGFYFITGRLKELIIKGGENIAPREIDEALLQHPAVLEAAAVGHSRSRIRAGNPGVRRAEAGQRVFGGRAARPLPGRARPLQDAEGVPFRRRAAEGAVGQGAAAEAGRGRGLSADARRSGADGTSGTGCAGS